jgi:superfamily I DNA and/or RNA helicase
LSPDRLALISPHRAQNNATAIRLTSLLGGKALPLPVIDTVERLQGAERDVILFAVTTSDPDHMMSEFLNNPHRFNVAITRARQKLIVVGSRAFFLTIPQDEEALQANTCFKEFFQFCRNRGSLFVWEKGDDC